MNAAAALAFEGSRLADAAWISAFQVSEVRVIARRYLSAAALTWADVLATLSSLAFSLEIRESSILLVS